MNLTWTELVTKVKERLFLDGTSTNPEIVSLINSGTLDAALDLQQRIKWYQQNHETRFTKADGTEISSNALAFELPSGFARSRGFWFEKTVLSEDTEVIDFIHTDGVDDEAINADVSSEGASDYYLVVWVRPAATSVGVTLNGTASGGSVKIVVKGKWQEVAFDTITGVTPSGVVLGKIDSTYYEADWSDARLYQQVGVSQNPTTDTLVARWTLGDYPISASILAEDGAFLETESGDMVESDYPASLDGETALDSDTDDAVSFDGTHVGCTRVNGVFPSQVYTKRRKLSFTTYDEFIAQTQVPLDISYEEDLCKIYPDCFIWSSRVPGKSEILVPSQLFASDTLDKLLVYWDGKTFGWSGSDVTPFTEEAVTAISLFVRGRIAVQHHDNRLVGRELMNEYMMARRSLYLAEKEKRDTTVDPYQAV